MANRSELTLFDIDEVAPIASPTAKERLSEFRRHFERVKSENDRKAIALGFTAGRETIITQEVSTDVS